MCFLRLCVQVKYMCESLVSAQASGGQLGGQCPPPVPPCPPIGCQRGNDFFFPAEIFFGRSHDLFCVSHCINSYSVN